MTGLVLSPPLLQRSSKTASFTASPGFFYEVNLSYAEITATLPPAADAKYQLVGFRLETGGNRRRLIIDGDGAETIDGSTTLELFVPGDKVWLLSDGTDWTIIHDGRLPCQMQLARNTAQTIADSTFELIKHNVEPWDYGNVGFTHDSHAITAVDTAADTFTISGNHESSFGNGTFGWLVDGSTGNDGVYTGTVADSGADTVFTADQDITDATVDGNIIINGFVARRNALVRCVGTGSLTLIDDVEYLEVVFKHNDNFTPKGKIVRQWSPGANQRIYVSVVMDIEVSAGDIIHFFYHHNEGGNINSETDAFERPEFSVSEIRILTP